MVESPAFHDGVRAGWRIVKRGTASVGYETGPFRQGDHAPAAMAHFVPAWFDRVPHLRAALQLLRGEAAA